MSPGRVVWLQRRRISLSLARAACQTQSRHAEPITTHAGRHRRWWTGRAHHRDRTGPPRRAVCASRTARRPAALSEGQCHHLAHDGAFPPPGVFGGDPRARAAGRSSARHRLFHALFQARTGPGALAFASRGGAGARASQLALAHARAAASHAADVHRSGAEAAGRALAVARSALWLAHERVRDNRARRQGDGRTRCFGRHEFHRGRLSRRMRRATLARTHHAWHSVPGLGERRARLPRRAHARHVLSITGVLRRGASAQELAVLGREPRTTRAGVRDRRQWIVRRRHATAARRGAHRVVRP